MLEGRNVLAVVFVSVATLTSSGTGVDGVICDGIQCSSCLASVFCPS